jgi:hypothetical protein
MRCAGGGVEPRTATNNGNRDLEQPRQRREFQADDPPERCDWCPEWRFEWVDLPNEGQCSGSGTFRRAKSPSSGEITE